MEAANSGVWIYWRRRQDAQTSRRHSISRPRTTLRPDTEIPKVHPEPGSSRWILFPGSHQRTIVEPCILDNSHNRGSTSFSSPGHSARKGSCPWQLPGADTLWENQNSETATSHPSPSTVSQWYKMTGSPGFFRRICVLG